MPSNAYARPPITEAVIDIQFENQISLADLQKVQNQFQRDYPVAETRNQLQVSQDHSTVTVQAFETDAIKLSTNDNSDIILVYREGLTNSRLAPYQGWDMLRTRAHEVYTQCKRIWGYRPIKRIGVRFINRIDIPSFNIKINDWVLFGVSLPNTISSSFTRYVAGVTTDLGQGTFASIHTGTADQVLAEYASILLDIDVFTTEGIPPRDDAAWEKIDSLRSIKNHLFEQCITDRTRALFDKPGAAL